MMMSGKSRLAALLGCDLPLLSSPMLGSAGPPLTLAVARAGGVGMLPCSGLSATQLDDAIVRLSGELQEVAAPGTVGYNFFCHQLPSTNWGVDAPAAQPWRRAVEPLLAREGVSEAQLQHACAKAADTRFNEALCRILVQRAQEGLVKVVSFHFGLPDTRLWTSLQSVRGLVTMCTATTVREAVYLARSGVDVIVCQGAEAGGHQGSFLDLDNKVPADPVGLFALLPQVRRALGPTAYLVAAGGVVDASTARAACVLGADGVQCGTVFLTAAEAGTNQLHRAAIERAKLADDALAAQASSSSATSAPRNLTNILTGRPARGLVNGAMAELGCVRPEAPTYPMATPYMAVLRSVAEPQGRDDYTQLWAGQNLMGCDVAVDAEGRTTAVDIVHRIAQGLQDAA